MISEFLWHKHLESRILKVPAFLRIQTGINCKGLFILLITITKHKIVLGIDRPVFSQVEV